jgi:hypothetical protein
VDGGAQDRARGVGWGGGEDQAWETGCGRVVGFIYDRESPGVT